MLIELYDLIETIEILQKKEYNLDFHLCQRYCTEKMIAWNVCVELLNLENYSKKIIFVEPRYI